MDKNFWDPIQSNSDYLSESAIWKNFNPAVAGNFVVPQIENFHVGPLTIAQSLNSNFGTINFSPATESLHYTVPLGTEIDFLKNTLIDQSVVLGKNMLVDACVDLKSLSTITGKIYDNVYTETAVARERNWFGDNLPEGHILHTHTRADFKPTGYVTLTAFDTYGPQSTVYYNTYTTNTHLCNNCNAPLSGTLTSGMSTVDVCQHLSSTDFSVLVRTVAFPQIFILITNEGCLGKCSTSLESYSLIKGCNMLRWT